MAIIETTGGLRFQELITYPQIRMEENRFTFITGESGRRQSALVFWNFGKQKDCRSHFLSKSEMIMRDLDIGAEK